MLDSNQRIHQPLTEDELNAEIKTLLSIISPTMGNAIGDLGKNLNFFVFKDLENIKQNFNPLIEGTIKVKFSTLDVTFQTPISSFLPLKKCPTNHEIMNGGWKYCPFHGTELVNF